MLGVVLFILILLFYGFVLSTAIFRKLLLEDKNENVKNFFDKWEAIFKSESARLILAIVAFTVGLWNFFAPDFGAGISPTIIGALIPAIVLILDSFVLFPGVFGLFNMPEESKNKLNDLMSKYEPIAGVVTIVAGILHIALFNVFFF